MRQMLHSGDGRKKKPSAKKPVGAASKAGKAKSFAARVRASMKADKKKDKAMKHFKKTFPHMNVKRDNSVKGYHISS